uniref:NADH-ubiquinone oxidoreductase chain 4 n=1 Tax=Prolachesilla sp. GRAspLA TaxID=2597032 RepID=A0A8K1ZFJ0_9NEOP|nr:NADH dehydrogenase subunit 4 [Prolachesilla sp. GRAspLA]
MLKFFFMTFLMLFSLNMNWIYIQVYFLFMMIMFLMEMNYFDFFSGVGYTFGLDLMSYVLIALSIWICLLMISSSEKIIYKKNYNVYFMFLIYILFLFLLLSFYSTNFFLFYMFFESSLIPTFLLIMGWGYQVERIQASIYLLMYTLISSLPLLLMIFYMHENLFIVFMFDYMIMYMNGFNILMFIFFYSAFLVKLPMFFLHLWLPKAHVEAPVAGSMILAGVLLKLGGYGLLRVSLFLYKYIMNYTLYIIMFSLFGGVLISLNCLRQSDVKLLIAYSSVSHMAIMLGGAFSFNTWGLSSTLLMMLSHGLCSSGLFFLINIYYERIGSRSLLLLKGMIHYLPKLGLWMFLFCAMNMAAPPSLNLLSEIGLINSLMSWNYFNMVCLGMMSFFAGGYSLYMFSFSQHGKFMNSVFSFNTCSVREFLILFLHWIPLNFLILDSEILMNWL